jgi:hypothetical protein
MRKSGRQSRNLHDAMVARLARSTLKDRFSVAFNAETSHWEISFNKLAEDDFNAIFGVPVRVASTNWDLGDSAEDGHRTIRLKNLTGSQARDFTRAVAMRFRIRTDSPLSNAAV